MPVQTITYKETFEPQGDGRAAMPRPPARCLGVALENFNENNPDATVHDVSLDMNRDNNANPVVEIEAQQTVR